MKRLAVLMVVVAVLAFVVAPAFAEGNCNSCKRCCAKNGPGDGGMITKMANDVLGGCKRSCADTKVTAADANKPGCQSCKPCKGTAPVAAVPDTK